MTYNVFPLNDTWNFDGTSWTQVAVPSAPPVREAATMATLGNQVVLFGGYGAPGVGNLRSDTWTFGASNWTEVYVSSSPPARQGATMATLGDGVVLFGGVGSQFASDAGSQLLNDTWTFDGTNWTEVPVSNPPPARWQAAMATLGNEVVLFGGMSDVALSDTWTFDGTSWTEVSVSHSPAARYAAAMATLGNEVVLFGGNEVLVFGGLSDSVAQNDTWKFNGTSWTQVSVSSSPSARSEAAMATLGSEVVLFGGIYDETYLNDTWTFNGAAWSPISETSSLSARSEAATATLP